MTRASSPRPRSTRNGDPDRTGAKPCVFCEIIGGRTSAHFVHQDDRVWAFLDNRPIFHGHVLIVPTNHVETLVDLPESQLTPLFSVAREVAGAVEVIGAEGSFVAINNRISQSVPHLHVHVVPRRRGDGLKGFFWPRVTYGSEDDMAEIANRLRQALTERRATQPAPLLP